MSRIEENEKLQEWFNGQIGKKYDSIEKAKCDSIGVIASALMDISKSLAIIADKETTTNIDLVVRQLREEADYAYADFDEYKAETLGADTDELPDDDFRYGLERAIEVIKAADRSEHDKNVVLDKIRAEIEEVQTYDGIYIDRAYVLKIIDKYKEGKK